MANIRAFQACDASSILAARTRYDLNHPLLIARGDLFAILTTMNIVMKQIISLEYAIAAIIVVVFYLYVGQFAWYWIPLGFLAFDLSALGYLVNNKIGALIYNIGHSLIGPAILMAIYIVNENNTVFFITLLWLFHIFVDRALGYGLKHTAGFQHTHLGKIGRQK